MRQTPHLEIDRPREFAIDNQLGSGWLLLRDNVKVQRRFIATMNRHPETGLQVELEIEVDRAGNPHCRGVRLLADPAARTFDDSITTASWRRINLASLVRRAFRDALDAIRDVDVAGGERVFETDPDFDASELDAIAPRGSVRSSARKPLTDDELRAIANVYEHAAAAGQHPTKLLADRFKVHRSTARRWVQKAEAAGYLGERLTPADGGRRSQQNRPPADPD